MPSRSEDERQQAERKRLLSILHCCNEVRRHRNSQELPDDVLQAWLIWHYLKIGESVSTLNPSTRSAMPAVPWRDIVKARNFMIHQFWKIDTSLILVFAKTDIDLIAATVEHYLKEQDPTE
jgi:uncharacterized protein with HEPN domain